MGSIGGISAAKAIAQGVVARRLARSALPRGGTAATAAAAAASYGGAVWHQK
jgi:hypothetical protein